MLKFNQIIEKNKEKKIVFEIKELEEIVEDFDAAIQLCVENQEYRKAIRYHYLKLLNQLNNAEIINTASNYTNNDIEIEIEHHNIDAALFSKLKKAYNAIWYGHYEIGLETYQEVNSWYQQFDIIVEKSSKNKNQQ